MIHAIVLAAGESRRMGMPKPLLRFGPVTHGLDTSWFDASREGGANWAASAGQPSLRAQTIVKAPALGEATPPKGIQGQDAPVTHGRDAHATDGRDARGGHGQDARVTHGRDAHATDGRDARGGHGQDARATHGRDAHATEERDTSGTHGRDARATHGRDAHATEERDTSGTHGRDARAAAGEDTTFLEQIVSVLRRSEVGGITVVLGAQARRVRESTDLLGADIVVNEDYRQGQLSSLIAGLWRVPREADGILLCLVDNPLITPEIVNGVVAAFRETGRPIVVPVFQGRRGHPALFARAVFEELLNAPAAEGARHVVHANKDRVCEVDLREPGILARIDTPEDYRSHFGTEPRIIER